jgi:phosphoglycolate phosphatase
MKLLMIDFDGVFVDSFELSYAASMKSNDKEVSRDEYRTWFHGNIFEHFDVAKQMKKTKPSAEDTFFKLYTPALMEVAPVEGMKELARELAERYPLSLVSSTINAPLRRYLHLHDMGQFFDTILGGDVHTSKVFKINTLKELYQVPSEDCLFITDTLGDIREATKCGVRSIAVSWGFHDKETLKQGEPLMIVDSPDELRQAIERR